MILEERVMLVWAIVFCRFVSIELIRNQLNYIPLYIHVRKIRCCINLHCGVPSSRGCGEPLYTLVTIHTTRKSPKYPTKHPETSTALSTTDAH